MQGYQITAYTGDPKDEEGRFDITKADEIISSWAPTMEKAGEKKREMEQKHGGRVMIEG